eukprot:13693149-Ditylum_brightwellii.AAC.1
MSDVEALSADESSLSDESHKSSSIALSGTEGKDIDVISPLIDWFHSLSLKHKDTPRIMAIYTHKY